MRPASDMNSAIHETGQYAGGPAAGTARATRVALEEAIGAAEPRALMVRPRILRRVMIQDRGLTGLVVRLPHRKSYVIGRDALLAIVDPDEIGLEPGDALPERVILLPQPSESKLAETPALDLLLQYWRLLFHARIDLELAEQVAAGALTAEKVEARVRCIGGTEFGEIRAVLAQEAFLLPPRDDMSVYCEFVAVYWELRYFAQLLLPRYFPDIDDFHRVEAILAEEVDAGQLFQSTRPPGVPDWVVRAEHVAEIRAESRPPAEGTFLVPSVRQPDLDDYRALVRRAEAAAARGNVVRSAICRARAELEAPPELAAKAQHALKRDLDRLVRRLQMALEIEDEDPHPWQQALLALARRTPRGAWTVEARLLYDLQKICIDHERGTYRVDLPGWLLSLGRQPIRRPLPAQREAAISKHLRNAVRRVPAAGLAEPLRQTLSGLLETAMLHGESLLRDRFRPSVARALDDAGLRPSNVAEKVAWKKLIEELLDRIIESGHLTMGDLRDAISRNNLKLADFSWRADGLRGDPLLRADRRLASALEGVHRPGEFYLRWMQRLSSLAFGTRLGRFVTRYLAVPFGGTFLVVTFVDHIVEKFTGDEATPSATWSVLRILLLGTFLMGLVNVEWFRRGTWRVIVEVCRAARDSAMGLVRWVQRIEWLKRLLRSRLARLAYRFGIKPAAITVVAWAVLPAEVLSGKTSAASGAVLFVIVNVLLNSRLGRRVEELVADGLMQAWRRLGIPVFTGLFYFFVDFFRAILEAVERLLYTVDEWLQFRTGETGLTFAVKAVLGPVWAFVTYLLRFCINLLIEPQFNPIKHFPVVTVSHKLLIPCLPAFIALLEQTMDKNMAKLMATAIIFGIPGIFGFLVWELKENWRLYGANRKGDLPKAIVGSHGETIGRLLRPGFHSGTLPKLFAKLRCAERRAHAGEGGRPAARQLRALRRVQVALRRFVERDLLELLHQVQPRQNPSVTLGPIRLSTNRIRIALHRSAMLDQPLEVIVEMRSGWLVARVQRPGWTTGLASAERSIVEASLAGFYKSSGVELILEQILAQLPPRVDCDVAGDNLVIEIPNGAATRVLYDLRQEGAIEARTVRGTLWQALPTLFPAQVLYSQVLIPWDHWVAFWQQFANGEVPQAAAIAPIHVLRPPQSIASAPPSV